MREKKMVDASNSFLHTHCQPEWWPALDANLRVFQFKKNELLFSEGSPVSGIYFMLSGVAKVHKLWQDEKELIIRFAHNQDIIGHRGLSTNSNIYPITATALTDVTTGFITLDFFKSTFKTNNNFAYNFMMFMADELQLSETRMRNLAHMTVRERLAGALLVIEKKFGCNTKGFINFTISRQDIAAYIGTTYETVYKIMNEFSESGFIKTNGKEIGIVNHRAIQNTNC